MMTADCVTENDEHHVGLILQRFYWFHWFVCKLEQFYFLRDFARFLLGGTHTLQ